MQIVISGMHRSGTSLVARLLAECGCYLGRSEDLMPAKPDNPEGFWENTEAVEINSWILEAAGVGWGTVLGGEFDLLSQSDRAAASARVHDFVGRMMACETNWAVKDPRFALTFGAWRPLLSDPVVVWCVRDPLEIGVSLQGRNGFPVNLGLALWEVYTIEAMRTILGVPIVVAAYEALLRDPVEELTRIVGSISEVGSETLRVPDASVVESLVKPKLQRSVVPLSVQEDFITDRRRRLMEMARSTGNWPEASEVPKLSELAKDEILRHRRLRQLEDETVLTPDALVHQLAERLELRSEEQTAFLDGKVGALHQRFDEVLTAMEGRFEESGKRDWDIDVRLGEIMEASSTAHDRIVARVAELEGRLAELIDDRSKLRKELDEHHRELERRAGDAEQRDRELELVRTELEQTRAELEKMRAELGRYRNVLKAYEDSMGGRLMRLWWKLRSR